MSSSDAGISVRPLADDELLAWVRAVDRAFLRPRRTSEVGVDLRRRQFAGQRVSAAVDDGGGGRIVGSFRSFDAALPVPGGTTVAADGVTSVTVAATHRRRGVLTTMMGAGLADARERGSALAVLIASEAPIYGRFGYGPATEACRWTLDSRATAFRPDPVRDGEVTLELVEDRDLRDVAPQVYAAAATQMPGAMPRGDLWWDTALHLVDVPGEDPERAQPAVLARDRSGRAAGYAVYRVEDASVGRLSRASVEVLDLTAATPDAYAALWRFLAEIDLTVTVTAGNRPVSEPLPWLLADRRAAVDSERADFQWVRLLDVPAALTARRYAVAGSVVVEVVDETGPAGCRVRLDVEPGSADGSAEVVPTTTEPDVVLDVAALGAAYLGQVPLAPLRAAGWVEERTPGAVARLSALLRWEPVAAVGHTWF